MEPMGVLSDRKGVPPVHRSRSMNDRGLGKGNLLEGPVDLVRCLGKLLCDVVDHITPRKTQVTLHSPCTPRLSSEIKSNVSLSCSYCVRDYYVYFVPGSDGSSFDAPLIGKFDYITRKPKWYPNDGRRTQLLCNLDLCF